jgi:hypothetical protein
MKYVYLPSNLGLVSLLQQNPPAFRFHTEDFVYLVGTIVRLQVQIKSNTEENEEGFVNLKSTYLQEKVRNYNRCLEYLIENGIVDRDYYIPGVKSFGYRLTEPYATQGYTRHRLTLKRLLKKTDEEKKRERFVRKHYGYLVQWFNPRLQIDYAGAKAYLDNLLEREQKEGVDNALRKYHSRLNAVQRIHDRDFKCSVDDTSFRFHSNLTNLKSELRSFVTYDGKTLCSIDVKNCQPFLSTLLFSPSFYSTEEGTFSLFSISPTLYQSISTSISSILNLLPTLSSSIMLVKQGISEASTDFERYFTLADQGELYPYLSHVYSDMTGKHYNLDIPDEKREFKNLFFSIIYGSNHKSKESESYVFRNVFKEYFKRVYQVFYHIKVGDRGKLPIILQSIESEIILKRIATRIAKEKPDVPIFTLHDNVVTVEEEGKYVYKVVKDEFMAITGLKPSLRQEIWTPPT